MRRWRHRAPRRIRQACVCSAALLLCAFSICAPLALALDPGKPLNRFGHEVWQDDLPQNTVHTVIQTRDGYLWLGTYEGLVRFNGVDFTVFDKRNTPAIHNNGIRALHEDRSGTLWVGTASGGLVAFKDGEFTSYLTEQGLPNNFVNTFAEDSNGVLWIGTNGGLASFENGQFSVVTTADGLGSDKVRSIMRDRAGTLWVGADDGAVSTLRDGRWGPAPVDNGKLTAPVASLLEGHDGTIWIGTEGAGLISLNKDGARTAFTAKDGLGSDRISALYEDESGSLWLGTDGGGLVRYFQGSFSRFSTGDGLSDTFVRSLCEDKEGSLWIGTNGGLNRLKEGKFSAYTALHGLSSNYTRVVCEDKSGKIWIGTDGAGLNCLTDNTFRVFGTADGLPNAFVRSLWPARDGALWIGTTGGGLCRYDGTRFVTYTTANGLAGNDVRAVFEDSRGIVWAGTSSGGLSRFENEQFTNLTRKDGLAANDVRVFCETPDGAVWAGTNGGGISRIKDGQLTTFTDKEGLASNVVFALYPDNDGNLWIGTNNGLTLHRNGEFTVLDASKGLFDDLAFQILEDVSSNLWLSCNKGVYRVNRKDLIECADGRLAKVRSVAYGRADGMGSNQCNGASQPSGWRGADGRMWFPTVNGVSVVDPNRISMNAIPPPVKIAKVIVNARIVPARDGLELPAGSNRFEFHYDGLSFLVPEKVRFAYKLEGLDSDWIDAGTRRVAFYTNLPPGTYTFRVRAANNDGFWNEIGASLQFHLPTPLWQTWWAYCLYLFALAGLILGVIRLRLHAMHKHTERLEAEVAARTVQLAASERKALEANSAKSIFLANMSHELRTPMNAILGFVQLMKRDRTFSPEQRENLDIVGRSGEHLLALINDVLSIAKIEAGHISLNEHPFDVRRMLDGLQDTFRLRAEAKTLQFNVDVAPGMPQYVAGDEGKVRQILINLLGNAFKFTDQGSVSMTADWNNGHAMFEVRDTGQGISPEDHEKLFQAFVQTQTGLQSKEGTGLGLAISRKYARLMGGDITVESQVGAGATFRVEIVLPVAEAIAAESNTRQVIGLEFGQPSYRILIVDDTLENRKLMVKLLGSVGFLVREAANGLEAVEQRIEWQPHLIWMDIRMPVMDGMTATRKIRAYEAELAGEGLLVDEPDIVRRSTVIALTASVFDTERANILASGCDEMIFKPFKEEKIFNTMAERLGVRFRYERTGKTAPLRLPPTYAFEIVPERFSVVPRSVIAELTRALSIGDVELVHVAINHIGDVDPDLADELRALARRFQFEEMLATVERA